MGTGIGLSCWAFILVLLALLSRSDVGAARTVEVVVALALGTIAAIGWALVARRARCRILRDRCRYLP